MIEKLKLLANYLQVNVFFCRKDPLPAVWTGPYEKSVLDKTVMS